jgi:hypothetical protein
VVARIALLPVFAAPTAGAARCEWSVHQLSRPRARLTMPNTSGPPLSLLAAAGALAVYGPLAIFGFSCAGAPRRARSRARVVLITKHTDGDEPGLRILALVEGAT